MSSRATAKRKKENLGKATNRTDSQCVHHWVIEPPNGRVSRGVCKKCGMEMDFYNTASVPWKDVDFKL